MSLKSLILMAFILTPSVLLTGSAEDKPMFKGVMTVIYHVDDIEKAKEWYSEVFEKQPYFDQSFYVGYNIGGYELGLMPDMTGITIGNNSVTYWGVEDIQESLKRLHELGIEPESELMDVADGDGVWLTTIKDPFGNTLGIIENRFFKTE